VGWGAYSYGDSAGFTPDFPFNPGNEAREPLTGANVGELNQKVFFIFTPKTINYGSCFG
jgi:hypothetical protein